MGYYMRGDYYRGDYYRGDFWSVLGGVAKKGLQSAVGAVKGAFTSGPYGAVTGAIKNIPHLSFGGGPPAAPGGSILPSAPPGGAAIQAAIAGGKATVPAAMMRGYHMNKSKLAPSKAHPKGAAPHTVLVRNRHMNVANPRALARASRRAHGFLRMTRKFVRYYTAKPHKGRPYIAKRRRSR